MRPGAGERRQPGRTRRATAASASSWSLAGTESDRYESVVLPSQQNFEKVLDGTGIGYERYEDTGAHIVRWGRVQQDIDSLLNHFAKVG